MCERERTFMTLLTPLSPPFTNVRTSLSLLSFLPHTPSQLPLSLPPSFTHNASSSLTPPLLPLSLSHLKKISGVSNGSEEVLPQCHLCLSSTRPNRLQKLGKLLDKLNHTRKKGILRVCERLGEGGEGGQEGREGKGR